MLDKIWFVYQAWRVPDSLGCGNLEFAESSGLEVSSGGRGEGAGAGNRIQIESSLGPRSVPGKDPGAAKMARGPMGVSHSSKRHRLMSYQTCSCSRVPRSCGR